MFVEFYGLHEDPFNLFTQRYLYLSVSHRKAVSSLQYGIEYGGGVQLLLGGAGLGKTALLRYLEARQQTDRHIIYLASTFAKDPELLKPLADSLDAHASSNGSGAGQPVLDVKHSDWQTHRRLVLLVDDAHELSHQELTSVIGLAKRVPFEKELIHLVLAGRPRLLQKLKQANAADSIQQIWLTPLGVAETEGYINYRLKMAAGGHGSIFTHRACAVIARQSEGVPRAINRICVEALLTGAKRQQKQIDTSVFERHELEPANGIARVSAPVVRPVAATSAGSHKPLRAGIMLTAFSLVAIATLWYQARYYLVRPVNAAIHAAPPVTQMPQASIVVQGPPPAAPVKRIETGLQTTIQSSSPTAAGAKELSSVASNVIASAPPTVTNQNNSGAGSRGSGPIANVASTSPRIVSVNASALAPESKLGSITALALPPSEVKSTQPNGQPDEASERSANPLGIADPHKSRVDAEVGDDYMRLGRYHEALEFYRDALAFAPGDEQIKEKIKMASAKATEE
jgi:type II secretory pathway predicted ATPase ExeA